MKNVQNKRIIDNDHINRIVRFDHKKYEYPAIPYITANCFDISLSQKVSNEYTCKRMKKYSAVHGDAAILSYIYLYGFYDGEKIIKPIKRKVFDPDTKTLQSKKQLVLPEEFRVLTFHKNIENMWIEKRYWKFDERLQLFANNVVWFDHFSYRGELVKNIKRGNFYGYPHTIYTYCEVQSYTRIKIYLVVEPVSCTKMCKKQAFKRKYVKKIKTVLRKALRKTESILMYADINGFDFDPNIDDNTLFISCYDLLERNGINPTKYM